MQGDPERQTIDRHVLDRYLAGESGAEERATVDAWLAAHPNQAARVARSIALPASRLEADWARILARVGEVPSEGEARIEGVRRRRDPIGQGMVGWRPSQWKWAVPVVVAAVAILAIVGVRRVTSRPASSVDRAATTYATNAGERANITLSDGSHVSLGVASQLQVPVDFARGDRTVRLVGEALFTVAHRPGAPFTVLSGAATTRVLGTSFLVRHYLTDTTTVVAVRDGKVAVRTTVLTAGKQMTVDGRGHMRMQPADPDQFAFATGVLVLRYMPLTQAIPELNRWYDADIRLGDASLATHGIRGRFLAGSSADLAEILGFDMRVVRDGRVLTLFSR